MDCGMITEKIAGIAKKERDSQARFRETFKVCMASGCLASNSDGVKHSLEKEITDRGLSHDCQVKAVGCLGLCSDGPLVSTRSGALYKKIQPADSPEIIDHIGREPAAHLCRPTNIPFFERQTKVVLENSGVIDPERIEDYIAADGYTALVHALQEMTPAQLIQEVTKSGLRGRGGAGYPTGLKWSTVAKATGTQKFVICNADEGDPGAFMDRSVLESDPHRVIEGMILAAFAVGATEGFIYIRAEYPLATRRLQAAIPQAEQLGLLGTNICGTPFTFRIQIRVGAGAYVCGEETALIASIEGKRGSPRPRPPYPAAEGLMGQPTLINNVETYANIPPIIRRGGAWYAGIGTATSKGTKVFSLTGQICHTGVVEVPMGISLREMVFGIGGGIPKGRKFKAVQTGGPSGGCIPAQFLDTPVDYESLAKLGSIMGSGGMVVMDESSCMVDVAKYFMDFCMSESCGKCIPCRVGTYQMHRILSAITNMSATPADLKTLEELCDLLKHTSLCGLGQSAPNPVLSTLQWFADEYKVHIADHKCRAGVCHQKKQGANV